MKITKEDERENPLLQRKEIKMKVTEYDETPSRTDLISKITAERGIDREKLVLDKIDQEYGKKEARCTLKVYDSKESKERYSQEYKEKRIEREEEE